jgi:hypothetical protein
MHVFLSFCCCRKGDITWHENNWGDEQSRFLAFTLHDPQAGNDLYVALNSHGFAVSVHVRGCMGQ